MNQVQKNIFKQLLGAIATRAYAFFLKDFSVEDAVSIAIAEYTLMVCYKVQDVINTYIAYKEKLGEKIEPCFHSDIKVHTPVDFFKLIEEGETADDLSVIFVEYQYSDGSSFTTEQMLRKALHDQKFVLFLGKDLDADEFRPILENVLYKKILEQNAGKED